MLQSIFDAVPVIIAAGIMLALGIFIARFAGDIVEQVLDGVGLDRQIAELDVLPAETKVVPVVADGGSSTTTEQGDTDTRTDDTPTA